MIHVIHRTWLGIALITVGALFTIALLVAAICYTHITGILTPDLFTALGLGILLVILVAYVWAYVYWLSVIEVSPDKIVVVQWFTLFSSRQAEAEWIEVNDITSAQPGIVSQLAGYGTLVVETAGTKPNLTLSYMANPEQLQAQLMDYVDKAKVAAK